MNGEAGRRSAQRRETNTGGGQGEPRGRPALVGMLVPRPRLPEGTRLPLLRDRVPTGVRRGDGGVSEMPNERYFEQLEHAAPLPRAYGVGSFSMGLDRVYRVVGECFPEIVAETIVCLSVSASLLLEDQQNPVAVNFEGPPSSAKTTLIDFLDAAGEDKVYRSDKFTPKSFVSHSASVSREKLQRGRSPAADSAPRSPRARARAAVRSPQRRSARELLDPDPRPRRARPFDRLRCPRPPRAYGRLPVRLDRLHDPDRAPGLEDDGQAWQPLSLLRDAGEEHSDAELVRDVAGGSSYKERVEICREAVADFLELLWMETGGVRGVLGTAPMTRSR